MSPCSGSPAARGGSAEVVTDGGGGGVGADVAAPRARDAEGAAVGRLLGRGSAPCAGTRQRGVEPVECTAQSRVGRAGGAARPPASVRTQLWGWVEMSAAWTFKAARVAGRRACWTFSRMDWMVKPVISHTFCCGARQARRSQARAVQTQPSGRLAGRTQRVGRCGVIGGRTRASRDSARPRAAQHRTSKQRTSSPNSLSAN